MQALCSRRCGCRAGGAAARPRGSHAVRAAVAAASRPAAEGAPRQRRERRGGAPRPDGGGSSGGGGSGGTGSLRRRGRRDEEDEEELLLDREFMEPEEAARLQRLLRRKGRAAVVDAEGFVRQPLLEQLQQQQQQQQRGAGRRRRADASLLLDEEDSQEQPLPAQPPPQGQQQQQAGQAPARAAGQDDSSDPSASGASSSSDGAGSRQRLFAASQLQAAAPGSRGAVPALPVVRPDASGASSSSSGRGPPSTAGGFHSTRSWAQLGASRQVVDALAALGISRPSHVQAAAYPAVLRDQQRDGAGAGGPAGGARHLAIADQAGSGKTLAYLLPLLQRLKAREAAAAGPVTVPNCPSIIVMAPTTELAQQVGRVVRALSGAGLRVRSAVMTGGQSESERRSKTFRTQCELLEGGVDLLVSTPGRLLSHLERGSLRLDRADALVLDEVDVLAGEEVNYAQHIAPLRAACGPATRWLLVSATLPQHTFDELQDLFPGLGAAFGPGLHRTATGVVEELIDCSGGDEVSLQSGTQRKLEALFSALDRVNSPRSVVFCNKIETCRVVENALRRRGRQVLAYHEAIREDARGDALAAWLAPPGAGGGPLTLVCTDRTSRGIDSMWCGHVVLFEFPRDPSEYVRRVGRTARGAGGAGTVTVLVLGRQVALANDILSRNRRGDPVHRVPRLWSGA